MAVPHHLPVHRRADDAAREPRVATDRRTYPPVVAGRVVLSLTFLGRDLELGRVMDAVLRVCLAGQTVTGRRVPTPHGVVKLVLTVSEDVADTVMRIVLEQDPHATRAPDPDL